ncbi:MAG: DUF4364 family protein [Clostridia bacterium]|nr:DUF4364 family protein [Clostridia bacterium]
MKLSDKTEIKIYILSLLEVINEPLSYIRLNDITVHDGVVTGFEFADSFVELLRDGLVEKLDGEEETFKISLTGHTAIKKYESMYSGIMHKAARSANKLYYFYRTDVKSTAEIEYNADKSVMLNCNLKKGDETIFSLSLKLTDYAYAEKLKDNFNENNDNIYKGVLALLSGDVNYIFE